MNSWYNFWPSSNLVIKSGMVFVHKKYLFFSSLCTYFVRCPIASRPRCAHLCVVFTKPMTTLSGKSLMISRVLAKNAGNLRDRSDLVSLIYNITRMVGSVERKQLDYFSMGQILSELFSYSELLLFLNQFMADD